MRQGMAYDDRATALLIRAAPLLEAQVDAFIGTFYETLGRRRGPATVLARLSPEELGHLMDKQAGHLRSCLDPAADETATYEEGRRIGRIHSLVGVEMDWYATAVADYQRGVFAALAPLADPAEREELHAILCERFMVDLQGALMGYRDVDVAQNRVLLRIGDVTGEARTVADLARGVLEALSSLEGLAVGFFGRPDPEGRFLFEVGAGDGVEAFMAEAAQTRRPPKITTVRGAPSGQGPSGRAWRSGEIERSDTYLTDPSTAPWHELGRMFGWRSSAAVPLADGDGRPRATLSLYARWPGYFAYGTRQAMLLQVKHLVERALVALEARPTVASGVRAYADRVLHLGRLEAGAVEMLFQPMVELASGRLVKLEALARLQGDEGLIPPAEFLPALGDEELLRLFDLGLDQALGALTAWEKQGLTTDVAVNLPSVSGFDDRYVSVVDRALERHGVDPARLTLEILETGDIDQESRWRRQVLDALKARGVRFAQDDLGSGYSSLLRLRRFDFDDMKIERHLVHDPSVAPHETLNFIRPLTSLAHSLGLNVVVEGLESDDLLEAALLLGVDVGQGYGIAHPMPAAAVVEWARDFRLGLDPSRPRTPLGALAGHLGWEHRLSVTPDDPGLRDVGSCVLTSYLAALGGPPVLAEAHDAVHAAALADLNGPAHRDAWARLAHQVTGRG